MGKINGNGTVSKQKPNRKEVKSVDNRAQQGAQLFEPVRKRVLMHVNLLKERSPKVRLAPQSSPRTFRPQVNHRAAVKATIPYDCHRVTNSVAANMHKLLCALHHVDVQQNCPTMHGNLTGNNLLTVIEGVLPECCTRKQGGGQFTGSAVQLNMYVHQNLVCCTTSDQ